MQGFNYYISSKQDGNISFYSGRGDVLANRVRMLDKIGYTLDDLVVMNQTHSSNFKVISREDKSKGSVSTENAIKDVDALLTCEKDIVLMAQGADCPLVLLYNKDKKVLAVIHSGWKGTRKRIIPQILSYMKDKMDCKHDSTVAIISPFAKGCCYEVTKEFKSYFLQNGNAFDFRDNKLYFDLGIIIAEQFREFGVQDIHFESNCTICGKEYFSYRREALESGRFALLAWMPT